MALDDAAARDDLRQSGGAPPSSPVGCSSSAGSSVHGGEGSKPKKSKTKSAAQVHI